MSATSTFRSQKHKPSQAVINDWTFHWPQKPEEALPEDVQAFGADILQSLKEASVKPTKRMDKGPDPDKVKQVAKMVEKRFARERARMSFLLKPKAGCCLRKVEFVSDRHGRCVPVYFKRGSLNFAEM